MPCEPNWEAWLGFAECVGGCLQRGESMLAFLVRHRHSLFAARLMKLWFPGTVCLADDEVKLGQTYADGEYLFCNIALPQAIKLGSQWEHYAWHGGEPHILMFRKPKNPVCSQHRPGQEGQAASAVEGRHIRQRSATTAAVASR